MVDEMAISPAVRSFGRRLHTLASRFWYSLWRVILSTLCTVAFRFTVEGREQEPLQGPLIVAVNHASAIDPVLAGIALRRQAHFMGKQELFSVPLLGAWLASVGTFPVRRSEPDRKALRHALQILERGEVLVMFPEGTRSPDGRLREAEPGVALLALRTGTPVLPIALVGSHRVLPKGARWPRLARVTARLGPPLAVPRVEGRLDHPLLETWGRRVIEQIAKLLPPDQGGTKE